MFIEEIKESYSLGFVHEDSIELLHGIWDICGQRNVRISNKWNLRGISWQEFPDNQKWFAMGETMSHIDYLVNRDVISKKYDEDTGIYMYSLS